MKTPATASNRPLTTPRILTLTTLSIVLALSACERTPSAEKPPAAAPPPEPVAPATPPAPATPAPERPPVQASNTGEAILAQKTIARYCDAWHKGAKPRITLRHDGNNTLTDDAGHSMSVSQQAWKAVVQQVRDAKQPVPVAASKSAIYAAGGVAPRDSFGVIPRYMYRIEVVDDSTVVYRTETKVDDGK